MTGFCQVQLTCASDKEADSVGNALLDKRLVACVKKIPIFSTFWWKGKVESSQEVLLLMESKQENFEEIEKEVGQHHSYNTFVLQTVPLTAITNKAQLWLNKEVRTKK